MRLVTFILVFCVCGSLAARAANNAQDDASDSIYTVPVPSWTNGMNGGVGFGAWQLSGAGPTFGFFVWNSTQNGDGFDNGNIGGNPSDSDIDTGVMLPVSWGLYASGGSIASARRYFTGSPSHLEPGQVFSVDFDNGYIEPSGGRDPNYISISLIDSMGQEVLTVGFTGGLLNYWWTDYNSSGTTTVPFGDEGLNFTVTIGSTPTDYTAKLTRRDGNSFTWSGTLTAPAAGFLAYNQNAGGPVGGPAFNLYINSMSIVPEPSTVALAAVGILVGAVRFMRRRS
ncbi:MAG: PEP-CTERM sorting domain-containing protein [Kiritimatiellae bacterium]|nr:PEP-CTERM sorting domain-containing protein [Kiritimatiellia bacterium]MDW8457983.1 PEP-CTERM sorting domain-containing protein [Verrucomicrobiota bacterium]